MSSSNHEYRYLSDEDNEKNHKITHSRLNHTISGNHTIIFLMILFFLISTILYFIFVFRPVKEARDNIASATEFLRTEATKAFAKGDKVFQFVTEIEDDVKEGISDAKKIKASICEHKALIEAFTPASLKVPVRFIIRELCGTSST